MILPRPPERNNAVDKFISTVEEFPKTKLNAISKPNIIKSEANAIKSLQNDQTIIIKEADKGGATVIMDREHYLEMVETTLNDKEYYEILTKDPLRETKLKYNKFLKKYERKLTKKEMDYLEHFEVKESQFYGLPKIHKSQKITNKCKQINSSYVEVKEVGDLKLRPIVAGPSCLTHRLSNLLDIILRPYTKHVQSNLRDTTDFLNNLPNLVPTDTILASFDIESLYSNIPHDLGIQAVRFWLEKYPETLNGRFSNEFILDGVRLILENNTFSFNDKYYKQVKGTAMGTKFAPVYATLTVGYLEQKLYKEIETTFGSEIGTYFIQNWKRFLDDCFLPWTKSFKDLEQVHAILNSLHKDLNFTLQHSRVQQAFLDVLVKNQGGKIETDIFYKETDSKQYLSFDSCHPRHTKMNIPYNLARRLRTIISEEHVVQTRMEELKSFLIKQKYPLQIIEHGINRAMSLDKAVLRTVKEKSEDKIIPYVSTYNPKDPELFNVIRDNVPILEEDDKMRRILTKYKLIKSKRQPYNLKRLLTKAKFKSNDTPKVTKCNKPTCGLCIHLLEGNSFTFRCGTNFTIHENMSCDVKNVVYVMKCRGCGEEYIGETGNLLRQRVTIHNQQIRDPKTRMIKVSEHIANCAHDLNPKYNIFPFYKMYSESTTLRRAKEKLFINTLKPKLNRNS
ncbi:MAG: GIY-YIG nuclease family protein [Candidatus Thiodiazotropha endolucinida]|nr:GIY-YIG nuclease family protein [Candidatus Thiodiazotropha taylori]MCW4264659.1 GIY-YIG nuclease family protein [Candidatus Thiodiazotropha endolucinida]